MDLENNPKSLVELFLDPRTNTFAQACIKDPLVYRAAGEFMVNELVTCLYGMSPASYGELSTQKLKEM